MSTPAASNSYDMPRDNLADGLHEADALAVEHSGAEAQTTRWRRAANSLVSLSTTLPIASVPLSAEDVNDQIEYALPAVSLVVDNVKSTFADWRQKNNRDKIFHPFRSSLAWGNLVFGEALAVGVQGAVQTAHASSMTSFSTGVASALAIEVAFTAPIAAKNKQKQPAEKVAEAAATAFWLGGAMGVENKKLPLKQAPAAIGAYMVFGTALAGIGEYNNLAEQVINNKSVILPGLILWGVSKKSSEYFGYDTASDKLANKSVALVRKLQKS